MCSSDVFTTSRNAAHARFDQLENVGDPVASGIAVANGVVFFTPRSERPPACSCLFLRKHQARARGGLPPGRPWTILGGLCPYPNLHIR